MSIAFDDLNQATPGQRRIAALPEAAAAPIVGPRSEPLPRPAAGIGAALPRPDGAAKVTGAARYAGEAPPAHTLHAVMVPATVAAGEVAAIDSADALRVRGVLRVLTAADLPKLQPPPSPPVAQAFVPMQGSDVRYEGQPVALVLAETLQAAEEAAARVRVSYRRGKAEIFATAATVQPRSGAQKNGYAFAEIDTAKGSEAELQAALRGAAAKVDAEYPTASRHHHPMEPSATVAQWRGDELHVWDSTQWTYGVRYALSALLPMAPEKIHVRCPFTGGGFGGKGYVWPHQVLAVLAAKVSGRPVKLNVARSGMFTDSGYQPAVVNRVRLAADAQGRLTAVAHDSTNVSSMTDDYIEFGSAATRGLYATPVLRTTSRIRHCHVGTPTAMRAPHEGPGMFALESAIDELALQLKMDPLALRLANHADRDPGDGKPFSSKKLRECCLEGARRFGWEKRPAAPRALRDGDWLLGWGMASCMMSTFRFASNARVTLHGDGTVAIASGAQEIGTGPYTVMAQIASQSLGIAAERIRLSLGDTALPETGGTFGSSTTLSLGSAVQDACEKLKARLKALVPNARDVATALQGTGIDRLSADGQWKPQGGAAFDAFGGASGYSMHTWGAIFVEVAVDEALGLVRLRRAVAGYSAGRIVNPRTARSQMVGGIIWGYGQAVLEESAIDERYGRYLSKNLSGVMVPVNADIPAAIDVFFVDEFDPHASAIGARGIGELGATGVSAAIANAVWHATGRRHRRLPLHMADLVAG